MRSGQLLDADPSMTWMSLGLPVVGSFRTKLTRLSFGTKLTLCLSSPELSKASPSFARSDQEEATAVRSLCSSVISDLLSLFFGFSDRLRGRFGLAMAGRSTGRRPDLKAMARSTARPRARPLSV
ncbi:hypothetical protein NL676_030049 [Syzygium grande]|nr:hypothetical protein NL676_030049 [Syzygium grande]